MKYLVSVFLYITGVVTIFVSITIYLLFLVFFPSNHLHWLAKILCRVITVACGQWVMVEGQVPPLANGPYLFLFNHASIIDPFPLGVAINHYVTGVMAKEQFRWPLWGLVMRRYGVIPIDRQNRDMAIGSMDQAETAILSGVSAILSPEGTRTLDGQLMPFKKGAFHIAKHTGVTIIPMVISGAFSAKHKGSWLVRPGIIRVRFLEPIKADDYCKDTPKSLSLKVYQLMSKVLAEM